MRPTHRGGSSARFIDDAQLVAGQRPAAGHQAQGGIVIDGRRHRFAFRQGLALHPVDQRTAPGRRDRQTDGTLGEAIDRRQRLGAETIGPEGGGEARPGCHATTGSAPLAA